MEYDFIEMSRQAIQRKVKVALEEAEKSKGSIHPSLMDCAIILDLVVKGKVIFTD